MDLPRKLATLYAYLRRSSAAVHAKAAQLGCAEGIAAVYRELRAIDPSSTSHIDDEHTGPNYEHTVPPDPRSQPPLAGADAVANADADAGANANADTDADAPAPCERLDLSHLCRSTSASGHLAFEAGAGVAPPGVAPPISIDDTHLGYLRSLDKPGQPSGEGGGGGEAGAGTGGDGRVRWRRAMAGAIAGVEVPDWPSLSAESALSTLPHLATSSATDAGRSPSRGDDTPPPLLPSPSARTHLLAASSGAADEEGFEWMLNPPPLPPLDMVGGGRPQWPAVDRDPRPAVSNPSTFSDLLSSPPEIEVQGSRSEELSVPTSKVEPPAALRLFSGMRGYKIGRAHV